MRRALAILGIVLGVLLIGYAFFGRRSEEELIRDRVRQLAEAVSFSEPNVVARGLALRGAFDDLFVPAVSADLPDLGGRHVGRDALVELGVSVTPLARSVDVTLSELTVTLDAERRSARVTAHGTMQATTREGEERWEDRSVELSFAKTEAGWQITALAVSPLGSDAPR